MSSSFISYSGRLVVFLSSAILVAGLTLGVTSCGGSKANIRKEETSATAQPVVVDVTTASAIVRELPQVL